MKFAWKEDGKRLLVVILAAMTMALNIKAFVRTGGLYPGGVTGLTVLLQRISQLYLPFELPYTLVNVSLNLIPVWIGFRYIGKKFTLYSLVVILLSGIFIDVLPDHALTYDTLLISIFGGIMNGVAISLCLSVDATSGGTDFIAIYLSQKKGVETWNLILGFNVVILVTAGLLFGWDKALYSIVFQYVSTQTLQMLYRNYQRQTLIIITDSAQEISDAIHEVCHHGASIIKAEGSHAHIEHDMVYSVISASDTKRVMMRIREIDPHAFINLIRSTEIAGRFYMKPKD